MAKRARSAPPAFTVSADLIRGLIDCAARCGMPRARFAGMLRHESGRSSPSSRYTAEHLFKVWERVVRLSGDPIIGLRMALAAELKTFGALGQILPRCATVDEAFRQTARYSALASQGSHIAVARDAATLTVSVALDVPAGPLQSTVTLWALTNLCQTPRRLVGEAVRPRSVACAFPSPGPAAARALKEHFPFTFDADNNRVVFDRRVGELAIPSADADLHALLAEVLERHLTALGSAVGFEQGLKAVLREMIKGTMPTLAALSAQAGMSRRTLQRRLSDANTSFQSLLQQVLREAAETLLAQGNLSQGEIAFLLGYSEVSAFSRAYRGWTGRPPGAARA